MTENYKLLVVIVGYVLGGIVLPVLIVARAYRTRKRLESDPAKAEELRQLIQRRRNVGNSIILTIAGALMVAGAWTIGKQCYTYLRYGEWKAESVLSAFDSNWAATPSDWIGLHDILNWVPLSFALILAGIAISFTRE